MKRCKAFTLIELLVVIGIIALLAGILLPAVNHMRRSAQITGEKADFQTITTALEQYKSDFGDYPRNVVLPKWSTIVPTNPTPAPVYYSLAVSLLGPGPAETEMVGSGLQAGDGAEGPGFREQISGAIPSRGAVSVAAGATSVTMTFNSQYSAQASAFASNFVPAATGSSQTPASITFFSTPTDPYPETVGIQSVTLPAGGPLTLTLMSPPAANHDGTCLITQPSGKVWGPYISADTFKTAFIPPADVNNAALTQISGYGQPVLLDRWGQVIQYFPTYGSVSNRTNDSTFFAGTPTPAQMATVSVGPLFGDSQAKSVDVTNGQNAIWDSRDGTPFYTVDTVSNLAFCQQWQNVTTPSGNTPYYFHPGWAVQWMLGGQPDPANLAAPENVITGSDKLSYSGPFILISAGPDGPSRANGGFCNMVDPSTGKPLPANTWLKAFTDSGNIYNFDRQ